MSKMGKSHLKRLAAPATWKISRKDIVFIAKPTPGTHRIERCMPLVSVIRDMLGYANTMREVKKILGNKTILIDGKRRKDPKFPVGLFDTVYFEDIKKGFRMVLSKNKQLSLVPITETETKIKPCKITGNGNFKAKVQYRLHDGRNILSDKKEYKNDDTLILDLAKNQVKEYLPLQKSCIVYLTDGKHKGHLGKVEDMYGAYVKYKTNDGTVTETLKKYVFVIGKDKPAITL